MRVRAAFWLLPCLALVLLTACTSKAPGAATDSQPIDTAALADPSVAGARAAVDQYMAARVAMDYPRVYQLLSAPSRRAYSEAALIKFFEPYLSYNYESLGEPVADPAYPQWYRFPLNNVQWVLKGEPPLDVKVFWVSVQYVDGRWGVALANPIEEKGTELIMKGDLAGLTRVADQMVEIDPWNYRSHLLKSRALLGGNEVEAALREMNVAINVAPDEFKPLVGRLGADVLHDFRAYPFAIALYQEVLGGIHQYPNWYPDFWEADTRRNMAESLLVLDTRQPAVGHAVAAEMLNPFYLRGHALVASLLEP